MKKQTKQRGPPRVCLVEGQQIFLCLLLGDKEKDKVKAIHFLLQI